MPTVVDVQELRETYGTTVAVDDISLQVEQGEIFGILGQARSCPRCGALRCAATAVATC